MWEQISITLNSKRGDVYEKSMKTFPVFDDNTGQQYGFEIENAYLVSRGVAELLKHVDGVSNVTLIGTYSSGTDIRVKFCYKGRDYSVIEPFGDNSRYLITPNSPLESPDEIAAIEAIFKSYKPSFLRRLVGDILTLKPLARITRTEKSQS